MDFDGIFGNLEKILCLLLPDNKKLYQNLQPFLQNYVHEKIHTKQALEWFSALLSVARSKGRVERDECKRPRVRQSLIFSCNAKDF